MSSETINPGFRGLVKANTLLPGRPPFGAGSFDVAVKTLNFSTPRPERSIVVALAAWRASYSRGGETHRLRTPYTLPSYSSKTLAMNSRVSLGRAPAPSGHAGYSSTMTVFKDTSTAPAHTSLARRARQVLRRQAIIVHSGPCVWSCTRTQAFYLGPS